MHGNEGGRLVNYDLSFKLIVEHSNIVAFYLRSDAIELAH
jgi:hypothetical protein